MAVTRHSCSGSVHFLLGRFDMPESVLAGDDPALFMSVLWSGVDYEYKKRYRRDSQDTR